MRIGDFNDNGVNLVIDKIIGGTNYCIGFSNKQNNGKVVKYYYPKSLLKADIKNYTLQEVNIYILDCVSIAIKVSILFCYKCHTSYNIL